MRQQQHQEMTTSTLLALATTAPSTASIDDYTLPPAAAAAVAAPEITANKMVAHAANKEITQENIKSALHEIISEIDREMEGDFNEEVAKKKNSYQFNSNNDIVFEHLKKRYDRYEDVIIKFEQLNNNRTDN